MGLACAVPAVRSAGDRRSCGASADGGDSDLPHGPGAEEGRQVPVDRSVQEELEGSHPSHVPGGRHLHAVLHAGNLVPRLGHQNRRAGRRRPWFHQS